MRRPPAGIQTRWAYETLTPRHREVTRRAVRAAVQDRCDYRTQLAEFVSTGRLGNQDTSPPVPLDILSSMPIPGVAGVGVETLGVGRAGLAGAFLAGARAAGLTAGRGALAAGATAAGAGADTLRTLFEITTVRCAAVAPRSMHRSGSSGQPVLARTIEELTASAANDMANSITKIMANWSGRDSFTNEPP